MRLGVVAACNEADAAMLTAEAAGRHGEGILDVIEAYRGYYAVYFSFTKHHGMHSPYLWCVGQLRRV